MADQAVTDAARALAALGASKGGKARAQKLSPARRREIARLAAEKRWSQRESGTSNSPPQSTGQ